MARPPESLIAKYKPLPGTMKWRLAVFVDASERSAAEISVAAGGSPDLIRDIFRRPDQSQMGTTIDMLARELGVTPAWLNYGVGPDGGDHQRFIDSTVAAAQKAGFAQSPESVEALRDALAKAIEQPLSQSLPAGPPLPSSSAPGTGLKGSKKPSPRK